MSTETKLPRESPSPRIRRFLFVSGVCLCVSLFAQLLAFAFPSQIPVRLYNVLAYLGLVAFATACWMSGPQAGQIRLGRLRRNLRRVVVWEWIVYSVAYLFLIVPAPGAGVPGPWLNSPVAFWAVSTPTYRSLYLGWLAAFASVLFCSRPISHHAPRPSRSEATGSGKGLQWPSRLLRARVLVPLFSFPLGLFLLGVLLSTSRPLNEEISPVLLVVSVSWLALGILSVAAAIIVDALTS
jgi:hypothetical protein